MALLYKTVFFSVYRDNTKYNKVIVKYHIKDHCSKIADSVTDTCTHDE